MRDPQAKAFYRVFGERLRKAREERHLSQGELGKLIGLNRTAVSNLEKGDRLFPIHLMPRLTAALRTTDAALLPEVVEASGKVTEVQVRLEKKEWVTSGVDARDLARVVAHGESKK